MVFGSVKEGFLKILDECSREFCDEVIATGGAYTLSFCESHACGALAFYGERDLFLVRVFSGYG